VRKEVAPKTTPGTLILAAQTSAVTRAIPSAMRRSLGPGVGRWPRTTLTRLEQELDLLKLLSQEGRFSVDYFVKYFSNSSCDLFAPASVNKIDFAFVAGSEMCSFRCRRSRASLLCPFQALSLGLSSNIVR